MTRLPDRAAFGLRRSRCKKLDPRFAAGWSRDLSFRGSSDGEIPSALGNSTHRTIRSCTASTCGAAKTTTRSSAGRVPAAARGTASLKLQGVLEIEEGSRAAGKRSANDGTTARHPDVAIHRPKRRVLMMSSHLSADDLSEAVARGAWAFVPKPFDLEDVWTLVREYRHPAD